MEHEERAGRVGVTGCDIVRQSGECVDQGTQCAVSLDTAYLYPELPVDGELISWPYLGIPLAGPNLKRLESRADGVGVFFADE